MTATLLYLIGEPGVGKTTALRAMTESYIRDPCDVPVPHVRLLPRDADAPVLIEIGKDRKDFGGTDALSMSIQPQVVSWMRDALWIARAQHPLILAEGDRLANVGFFQSVRDIGYRVLIIHLVASPATLALRRSQRSEVTGHDQNPTWLQGRRTKTQRLARATKALPVNTEEPPDVIADILWTALESGHESSLPPLQSTLL